MRFRGVESYACPGKWKLEIIVESCVQQGLTFSLLVFCLLGAITIRRSTKRVIPSYSFFWRVTNNRRLTCGTFGQQGSAFSPCPLSHLQEYVFFKTQAKYSPVCLGCSIWNIFIGAWNRFNGDGRIFSFSIKSIRHYAIYCVGNVVPDYNLAVV